MFGDETQPKADDNNAEEIIRSKESSDSTQCVEQMLNNHPEILKTLLVALLKDWGNICSKREHREGIVEAYKSC